MRFSSQCPLPESHPRLAFVDIETTGLSPTRHRIAEIGVVSVDANGVDEWTTLIDPGRRIAIDGEFGAELEFTSQPSVPGLPRFADIAAELAARLDGRLFIAHNARFDQAFVRAELRRAGIEYAAPALCTVMLSRKLDPDESEHHLDALIERHGLDRVERHRALPDARALYRFWQAIVRKTSRARFDRAIGELLALPLLPPHLDPDIFGALPERPGVFVLEDAGGRALHVARAANLRRQAIAYFRIDRQCARADELSHRVSAIRVDVAEGPLDARLIEIARRDAVALPSARKRTSRVTIVVDPSAPVVARTAWLADCDPDGDALYGLFATERKAHNALAKIARRRDICSRLLGLPALISRQCAACTVGTPDTAGDASCAAGRRAQHLVRFFTAIAPLRLPQWPYRGPIAIRERRKVHVFDHWRHLGSVRAGSDVAGVLEQRTAGFDPDVCVALMQSLPRIASRSIRVIGRKPRRGEDPRSEDPRGEDPRGEGPRGEGPRGEGPRGEDPRGEGPRGEGPRGEEPRRGDREEACA